MFTRRTLLLSTALPFLTGPIGEVRAQDNDLIGPMREMLALLPPLAATGVEDRTELFSWVDLRGLLETLGIDDPSPGDYVQNETLFEATRTIAFESGLFTVMLSELPDMVGFSITDIDQFLVAFASPDRCRVYRGTFDVDRIVDALTGYDYAESSEGHWTILSSPGGDRLEFDSPIDSLAPVEFHYVMVRENMIITAGIRATVDAVLDVAGSPANLLADLDDQGLLAEIETSTSALLLDGSMLSYEALQATPTAEIDALPAVDWFAGGVWYGPDGPSSRYLVEFTEADAEMAAGIIANRLETGVSALTVEPYSEVFGEIEVSVLPKTGIVEIAGDSQEFSRSWFRAIAVRDLYFLATR